MRLSVISAKSLWIWLLAPRTAYIAFSIDDKIPYIPSALSIVMPESRLSRLIFSMKTLRLPVILGVGILFDFDAFYREADDDAAAVS